MPHIVSSQECVAADYVQHAVDNEHRDDLAGPRPADVVDGPGEAHVSDRVNPSAVRAVGGGQADIGGPVTGRDRLSRSLRARFMTGREPSTVPLR